METAVPLERVPRKQMSFTHPDPVSFGALSLRVTGEVTQKFVLKTSPKGRPYPSPWEKGSLGAGGGATASGLLRAHQPPPPPAVAIPSSAVSAASCTEARSSAGGWEPRGLSSWCHFRQRLCIPGGQVGRGCILTFEFFTPLVSGPLPVCHSFIHSFAYSSICSCHLAGCPG